LVTRGPTKPKPNTKPPDLDNLGEANRINLINVSKVLEIKDVKPTYDSRPLITINAQPAMTDDWLFHTCASISCMSTSKLRSISISMRPKKSIRQAEF
jgi:hypothetical protein